MRSWRDEQSAFTLVELVIALGIFGIIMTVAYLSLTSLTESKQALDDTRDNRFVADAVLGRMTRELQLAFAGLPLMPPQDNLSTPNSSKVCLIGEQGSLSNGEAGDRIEFLAMEGGQYLPDGGSHSGVVQISYRVELDPERPAGGQDSYLLIRQETPYIRPFDKAYEKTMVFPVVKNIVAMRFRYLLPNEDSWAEEWGKDTRINLPRLLEFTIKLRSPKGTIETFTTSVPFRSKP